MDLESMDRDEAIAVLKQLLAKRGDALRKALQGDLTQLQELNKETAGELADFALDAAQCEMSSQMVEVQSRELAQTISALEKASQGVYGDCEVCNEQIALPRLIALPYTNVCIECARHAETHAKRVPAPKGLDRARDKGDSDDERYSYDDAETYA